MEQSSKPEAGRVSGEAKAANEKPGDGKRKLFILLAIGLFGIIIAGLTWIFGYSTTSPIGLGWFIFSFAAGLSMIVLPCTLPLAFVIVPLSMGKGYAKGLVIALAFGLGVAITLSMYGILAAVLGQNLLAYAGTSGEVIKNIFYAIAGVFAIVFGLGELGMIKFKMPSYMGGVPGFIQRQGDVAKALFLGLFLGNIGVGCPHPATPIILGQIGVTGDVFYGWLLFFVHAIGRIIPLLLLAILGILGVNATKALVARKDSIMRATAWGMVFVGAFLFTLGFFSHSWWVASGTHTMFETITQEHRFTNIISRQLDAAPAHMHGLEELTGKTGFFDLPLWLGNWVFVGLMVVPLLWFLHLERKRVKTLAEPEKANSLRVLKYKKLFVVTLSLLMALSLIYAAPTYFLNTAQQTGPSPADKITARMETDLSSSGLDTSGTLTFTLTDDKGAPLTGIQKGHDRYFHVLITSEDLEVFAHVHPDDAPGGLTEEGLKNGTFFVNYTFPQGGKYYILLDFNHQNNEINKRLTLDIPLGKKNVTILKDLKRVGNFEGYDVNLGTADETIKSGESTTLQYKIYKNGSPVKDMEPYLAAPMHLAIWSIDFSYFLHTHGEIHIPGANQAMMPDGTMMNHGPNGMMMDILPKTFGPDIESHVVFPWPGLYKIFGQFNHQGKIVTTSFMVEVAKGANVAVSAGHGH